MARVAVLAVLMMQALADQACQEETCQEESSTLMQLNHRDLDLGDLSDLRRSSNVLFVVLQLQLPIV